jgi:cystathionine beta-lyase/cystathionine gamma-synthase
VPDDRELEFATLAIHAGQDPDAATGATIVPVYATTTYTQEGVGQHKGYEYSRGNNPTRQALETCLAALEGARHGLAYASGMAAITGTMQLVGAGDHVVVADDLYGGSYRLFSEVLPGYGVSFSWVDATRPEEVEKACRAETKLVWIESPTNPMLRLVDVSACAEIAHRHDAKLVIDNTFATPYLQRPLALGADLVVHSTTKWVGGHSDVIGGVVLFDDDALRETLAFTRNATGGIPGPFDSWLTLRGARTLAIRMREHCCNARIVADFLRGRPEVARVHYPGLADHPGHELAARQMRDFGAVVTIELVAGEAAARRFVAQTRLFSLCEGLGGVESQIGYPWSMSHGSFPPEQKLRKGITQATVRLSVGIEDAGDLCNDLARALEAAHRA